MNAENVSGVVEKPVLGESKLYNLSCREDFLGFLKPEFSEVALTEATLDHQYPREESDEDYTRIFINYTNQHGNSVIYKINDTERLARNFNIDHFINGYFATVHEGMEYPDLVSLIKPALVTALNTATVNALDFGPERLNPLAKKLSTVVMQSLISILLNDPLDAIIMIREVPNSAEGSTLLGVWAVKSRD